MIWHIDEKLFIDWGQSIKELFCSVYHGVAQNWKDQQMTPIAGKELFFC